MNCVSGGGGGEWPICFDWHFYFLFFSLNIFDFPIAQDERIACFILRSTLHRIFIETFGTNCGPSAHANSRSQPPPITAHAERVFEISTVVLIYQVSSIQRISSLNIWSIILSFFFSLFFSLSRFLGSSFRRCFSVTCKKIKKDRQRQIETPAAFRTVTGCPVD